MHMERQEIGRLGEKLALRHLKKRGYRILDRNFRCRRGEIDIVAEQKDYLVFVEVRTKTTVAFGTPEESITQTKKDHLVAAALTYISEHPKLPPLWRIDVVAIELEQKGRGKRIEIIENAVGSS